MANIYNNLENYYFDMINHISVIRKTNFTSIKPALTRQNVIHIKHTNA